MDHRLLSVHLGQKHRSSLNSRAVCLCKLWSVVWSGALEKSVLLVYPSFVHISAMSRDGIYPIKKIKSNNQCCSHTLPFPGLLVANFMQTDFVHLLIN